MKFTFPYLFSRLERLIRESLRARLDARGASVMITFHVQRPNNTENITRVMNEKLRIWT